MIKEKIFFQGVVIILVVFFLNGCAIEDKNQNNNMKNGVIINPIEHTENMVNLGNNLEKNIKQSMDMENEKIQNALNETDADLLGKYNGAIMKTNFGEIKVKFYNNDSPKTVLNFMKLARQNFYNQTKFHRVMKDFMIQGGDPNSKDDDFSNDGLGGPGYKFADEFNKHKLIEGSLAMANSGPNTNGSQFFIVTTKETPWLDGKHTNFGEIFSGMDVVLKIEKMKTDQNDHPIENAIIEKIELIKI